jgi:hypothetical protein
MILEKLFQTFRLRFQLSPSAQKSKSQSTAVGLSFGPTFSLPLSDHNFSVFLRLSPYGAFGVPPSVMLVLNFRLSAFGPAFGFPLSVRNFQLPNRLYPFGSAFGFPLSSFRSLLHLFAPQWYSRLFSLKLPFTRVATIPLPAELKR